MRFVSYSIGDHRFIAPEMFVPPDACIETAPSAISKIQFPEQQPPLNPHYRFSQQLQQTLYGKKLLPQELSFPIEQIHNHYLNGYITYKKGIAENELKCERCGNTKSYLIAYHECAKCGRSQCVYCRHCIAMGKVSECTPLLTWCGPSMGYSKRSRVLQWQGELSEGQRQASEKIVAAVGRATKLLVWAVCGSGKTEILFEGINKALEEGQHVVIATPRSDVVHELTPRIKKVFPEIDMIALYGGSEDHGKQAQLVIATTHQLLRYENHFDFVVIDEVDAFPFSFDPMLKYAVKQASKHSATTILLTATPDQTMQHQVAKGKLNAVKIPKRYHGYPLPVPTLCWAGNWRSKLAKDQLPQPLVSWIAEKLQSNQQAFLFVPSIKMLNKLVPILQRQFCEFDVYKLEEGCTRGIREQRAFNRKIDKRKSAFDHFINRFVNTSKLFKVRRSLKSIKQTVLVNHFELQATVEGDAAPLDKNPKVNPMFIQGVYSEDPHRREKVQRFRNREIKILVTTTILERGVTVPNVAVAVYGADDDVFTESALVQISGRVGRSAQFPNGEIVFFHYGRNEAIVGAISHIEKMNKLAGFDGGSCP